MAQDPTDIPSSTPLPPPPPLTSKEDVAVPKVANPFTMPTDDEVKQELAASAPAKPAADVAAPVVDEKPLSVPTTDEVNKPFVNPLAGLVNKPVEPKPTPALPPVPPVVSKPAPAPTPAPAPAPVQQIPVTKITPPPAPAPTVLRPTTPPTDSGPVTTLSTPIATSAPTTVLGGGSAVPPPPPAPAAGLSPMPAPITTPPAPTELPPAKPAAPLPYPTTPVTQKPAAPLPAGNQPVADQTTPRADEMMSFEDEKPRPKWLIPVIVGAGLVVVFGTALVLQSSGTIYSPTLAAIVGGVPHSPTKALPVIANRLTLDQSYTYDGMVAISFGTALPDISQSNSTTTTAEASGTISGQVKGSDNSSTFDFTLGPDYPVVNLRGKSTTTGKTINVYLDTLALLQTDNGWRELDQSDTDAFAVTLPLATTDLNQVLAKAGTGTFQGATTLQDSNKTPVLVFEYNLSPLIESKDANIKQQRLLVWVAKKTGRVLVAKVDSLVETALGTVVVQQQQTISKHGQSEVTALPTDAKPVPIKMTELYKSFGIGGTTAGTGVTPGAATGTVAGNVNDAKRLADLTSIKEALAKYKTDYGLYPISKERSKSTDTNFVLKGSLVSKYMAAIPTDPAGGSNYYGYTSDGFSFTLSSILEDKSSPGAISGSGFYYQEIKNN